MQSRIIRVGHYYTGDNGVRMAHFTAVLLATGRSTTFRKPANAHKIGDIIGKA
jgi:hypothetical protein